MRKFYLLFCKEQSRNFYKDHIGSGLAVILVSLFVCFADVANAQTYDSLHVQGTPCTGQLITVYLQGSSTCQSSTVLSASSWNLPGATNIVFSGNFLSVSATWATAATYSVTVGYTCVNGGTSGNGTAQKNVVIKQTMTPTVSLSLSNGSNPICQGSNLTFTASGTNAGTTPTYTFFIDGVSTPTTSATTYTPASLATGSHTVYVQLTSSPGCSSPTFINSTTIPFTVSPIVSFTANLQGPGVVCAGSTALFTATPSVAYGTLSYKWYMNGAVLANQTASTLQTVVNQGATIYCIISSTYSCLAGTSKQVQSNTFTVNLNVVPTLSVSQSKFCTASGSVTLTVAGVPTENKIWQYQSADNGAAFTNNWTSFGVNASSQNFTLTGITGLRTYQFKVICASSTCSITSSLQNVTISSTPTATAQPQTFFVGSPISVAVQSIFTNATYSYTVPTASNIPVSTVASTSAPAPIPTSLALINGTIPGTANLSITQTANGCTGSVFSCAVSIYPLPQITSSSKTESFGGQVTLSAQTFYDIYKWQGVVGISTSNVTKPGTYNLIVTKGGVVSPSVSFILGGQFSDQNLNFIVTNTLMKNITDTSRFSTLPIDSINQTVQYFDGLGSLVQTIVTQGSPLKQDLVTPTIYDAYGRNFRTYLPVATGNDGDFKSILDGNNNYTGAVSTFYSGVPGSKIAGDSRYFSETTYEASPLNRPSQEFGPGQNWKTKNKNISYSYLVNQNGTTGLGEQIIVWTLDPTGMPIKSTITNSAVSGGYYTTGQLLIKSTTDEQGYQVREYSDKEGHLILKKVELVGGATLNNPSGWTQTYYIYDDAGNSVYVLSPEALRGLKP